KEKRRTLVLLQTRDMTVPDDWKRADPEFVNRFVREFNEALQAGLTADGIADVSNALEHLAHFVSMTSSSGTFTNFQSLKEDTLQQKLLEHLRSRGINPTEGAKVGGGVSDVILPGGLVVENKVRDRTAAPLEAGKNAEWQARRYAIAVCRNVL